MEKWERKRRIRERRGEIRGGGGGEKRGYEQSDKVGDHEEKRSVRRGTHEKTSKQGNKRVNQRKDELHARNCMRPVVISHYKPISASLTNLNLFNRSTFAHYS